MGSDRFPELLIEEKTEIFDALVKEKWWIFYTHDSRIAMSHVTQDAGKFVSFEPQTEVSRMDL
jgi:hypothetical protein